MIFDAENMNKMAQDKGNRDILLERNHIINAIINEARNGNYQYKRGHLFVENRLWLENLGFICSNLIGSMNKKYWHISWGPALPEEK